MDLSNYKPIIHNCPCGGGELFSSLTICHCEYLKENPKGIEQQFFFCSSGCVDKYWHDIVSNLPEYKGLIYYWEADVGGGDWFKKDVNGLIFKPRYHESQKAIA